MDDARLEALRRAITARGWRWREGKEIPYGAQLVVTDGEAEATLDFYPKRGRTVIGGADSPLRRALQRLAEQAETGAPGQGTSSAPKALPQATSAPKPSPRATTSAAPGASPAPAELGMDESGKGDWFGPLVVAAVYVEPGQVVALRKAGVQDSKLIESAALPKVAAAIEALIPPAAREVLALAPVDYNRRYAALANINLLLAELYAETALAAVTRTGARIIVCDQFAQRAERLDTAFARVGLPRPRQLHHAEAASLAVAAASVLATARFQAELVRLGAAAGLGGPLPRGASAVRILSRAARTIIAREGAEGLGRYAKLNFKPVQEILGR
jgi:ribonuclease HIII